MNVLLFTVLGVAVTPWRLVGLLGTFLFAGRWLVQLYVSRRHRRPTMPSLFWYMSVSGSLLLLLYFSLGNRDVVGVLNNLFPAAIAGYNLYLDIRSKRVPAQTLATATPSAPPVNLEP